MQTLSFVLRTSYFAPAVIAAAAAMTAGCVHYVDPAKPNPAGDTHAYTRSESLTAEQRLVNALLSDPTFAQHYSVKVARKGGAVPALQVAHIDNLTTKRVASLDAIRRDLETALRSSGRFVLSGDIDACDYVLKSEYREIPDGKRVMHQLALRLHDTTADIDVWTGSDEIAKQRPIINF